MINGQYKSIGLILWKILKNPLCSELTYEEAAEYALEFIRIVGAPMAFLTKNELLNSLCFISKCLDGAEISYSYLFVKNTILNYEYVIVKFLPNESYFCDFF